MQIAYGTYAMPRTALEDAIPALSSLGYDGVEICINPQHVGSMPNELDVGRRRRLNDLLRQHGMGVPALFMLTQVLQDDSGHGANLEHTRRVAGLARDLGIGETPVLAICIGGRSADWEAQRQSIVDRLGDYDQLAREESFSLACEPHTGAAVDRSERALWLFQTLNSPRIGLHFDVIHFYQAGESVEESVRRSVPITLHTHVTDARKRSDGGFDLVLLGQGELDTTAYVKAMHKAGWRSYITAEVSVRIWGREDYDPIEAARVCYASLDRAFVEAGVPRT